MADPWETFFGTYLTDFYRNKVVPGFERLGNINQAPTTLGLPPVSGMYVDGVQNMGNRAARLPGTVSDIWNHTYGPFWDMVQEGGPEKFTRALPGGDTVMDAMQSPSPDWLPGPDGTWGDRLFSGLPGTEGWLTSGNPSWGSNTPTPEEQAWWESMYGAAQPVPPGPPPQSATGPNGRSAAMPGGGGGGSSSSSAGSGLQIPGYPDVPVPQMEQPTPFDRTKIDELLAKAQPKAPEGMDQDFGLALILGALQGFDPRGSAGEILGRLAGPAGAAGLRQHQQNREREDNYEASLSDYYGNMAEAEGNIQNSQLSRDDAGKAATFQNAIAQRAAALEKAGYDKDVALAKATYDLNLRQVEQGDERNAISRYLAQQRYQGSSGKGSIMRAIMDVTSRGGALPGVDMTQIQQLALQQALAADPNLQAYPERLAAQVKTITSQMLMNFAMDPANAQAVQAWGSMYETPGNGLMDLLSLGADGGL